MNFPDFAQAHGLIINRVESGRWVRVPTIDHPRSRNGAYFHDGGYAHIQNWAEMTECLTWRDDSIVNPAQIADMRRRMDASRRQHAQDRAMQAVVAAKRATAIIGAAKMEQHEYLKEKGFRGMLALTADDGRDLIVPMRDMSGQTLGVQVIRLVDGAWQKKMIYGMRAAGAVHVIGTNGIAVWCEGWATGLSIAASLRALSVPCRVHVCFSAGNMSRMAKSAGKGFVIADNDPGSNAGVKAAESTGLPFWLSDVPGEDFNDYHRRLGTFKAGMELRKALQFAKK